MRKILIQLLKLGTLRSLIEFKHIIIVLNLNILGKDNIVCLSLVNTIICLNSNEESNLPNLRNRT